MSEEKLLDEAIMAALEPILRSLEATAIAVTIQNKYNYCHGMTATTNLVSDETPFEIINEMFIDLLKDHIKKLEGLKKNE